MQQVPVWQWHTKTTQSPSSYGTVQPTSYSCPHVLLGSSSTNRAVQVTSLLFLHIWVTVTTVPYFFPPRQISCATFFTSLTGTPYLTSHDAISSNSFRGFFLFASLSLLNTSSSSVSAMESSGLKSPWSSAHNIHTLPLGKSVSAFFCRLALLRRLTIEKAWGMVQAWVGHFVTPLSTYDEYDWRVTS